MLAPETIILVCVFLFLFAFIYLSSSSEGYAETCKQRCTRLTDSLYPDIPVNKNNRSGARVTCMTNCTETISDQQLLNIMRS